MSSALSQLISLLKLQSAGENRFIGQSQNLGLPQIFGGQIMAQSLVAAQSVAEPDRVAHSFHATFLQAGDVREPLQFDTEILRSGGSFTVVNVRASQSQGVICLAQVSFQTVEEGREFQCEMPDFAPPENFSSENQFIANIAEHLPSPIKTLFSVERPFIVQSKHLNNPFAGKTLPPAQQLWAKLNGKIPLTLAEQQCLLLYFSDFHCLPTMLFPHGKGALEQSVRMATLEHSFHFYRPFDFHQWLAFALETQNSSNARGICHGSVFSQEGKRIASYCQEGLIRILD